MKYLVIETCNGELFRDIWVFNDINNTLKFIESCAFATDSSQWLEEPVIEVVSDDYKMSDYEISRSLKRFRGLECCL